MVRRKVIARFSDCMRIMQRGKRLGYRTELLEQIDKSEFEYKVVNIIGHKTSYSVIPCEILSKLGYNFIKDSSSTRAYSNMIKDNDFWLLVLTYEAKQSE